MKKNLLSILLMFVITYVNAQAPKLVLFEHFTQASCGPCAAQNPGFVNAILTPNPDIVRHIAYHTSWPGVDPMNTNNPTQVASRVTLYNVTGVPNIMMGGNKKQGAPASFSQADVDNVFGETSPIKIEVIQTELVDSFHVDIVVKSIGTPPTGNFKLMAAVIEREVVYPTAPGNNGELEFPNVFRRMYPSTSGAAITLASQGSSFSYNFSYSKEAIWNLPQIATVVFIQNTVTNEIINCGTNFDQTINATLIPSPVIAQGGIVGGVSTFNLIAGNSGTASEDFRYILTSNAPANWGALINVGGIDYSDSTDITTPAGATNNISIKVTPGAAPFIATYTLLVKSITNPSAPAMSSQFYVVSGVTDIIVSNSAGRGDGTGGSAADWEPDYTTALTTAGCTTLGYTNEIVNNKCYSAGAYTGVSSIYYNVGWTFPGLTDAITNTYTAFLSGGGNLYIAGQDIGWETWDANGSGTTITKAFYTNYLNANYISDGSTSQTLMSPFANELYNSTGNVSLINFYGSGTSGPNYYPDILNVAGIGVPIYYYDTDNTKIAGIRATNGIYKTVYIAPGIEMYGTASTKNLVMGITYQWFHGMLSNIEFDGLMENLGRAYPNPANNEIIIPSGDNNSVISLYSVSGQLIKSFNVNSMLTKINTTELAEGAYYYTVTGKSLEISKGEFVVTH